MRIAVVTLGLDTEVRFIASGEESGPGMSYEESQEFCEFPYETEEDFNANATAEHPCAEGPSALTPEPKELLWGGGAFLVLLIAMRLWLFPAVKKGMDARYALIEGRYAEADHDRSAATGAVDDYEAQLAKIKAEAAARVDAVRAEVEATRSERVAAANAAIAERRSAADAQVAADRAAVQGEIANAVADVTRRTVELATGRAPAAGVVDSAVASAMSVGATS